MHLRHVVANNPPRDGVTLILALVFVEEVGGAIRSLVQWCTPVLCVDELKSSTKQSLNMAIRGGIDRFKTESGMRP